jgi:uncharacterized protein (DUF2147 family)
MKNTFFLLLISALLFTYSNVSAQADEMVGLWETIDDETGEAKSHVKIFKATNGKYYGRIEKLLTEPADKKCEECKGALKNKPIVGMRIINGMTEEDGKLEDGKILDPGNGKFYHCTIELNGKDKLEVRGSLDSWGLAGRTQTWHRVK